ncbi:MAG TPA: outer membrane beta-barrel protein [Vicinamibacterales bacterium]|nr:outer membrane beta-barrel protein [Vicinamibacterales bacterium]
MPTRAPGTSSQTLTVLACRAVGVLVFLLVSLAVVPAGAQTQREDPSVFAAMRFGSLAISPTLAIRDVGVDTNVLGTPDSDPEFTMSFVPGVLGWLRIGRLRLSTETEVEWQYFQKTDEQRSFSVSETAKVELLLAYLTPYASGTYDNTKRRQTSEFDARVRQKTTGYAGGVTVYPGPRTDVDLQYRRMRYRFGDEVIVGVDLATLLDRDNTATELNVGYAVTPLTRVVARLVRETDEFDQSDVRNSDSWSILPGLEFKPSALISGSAHVGYRSFDMREPGSRDFQGVVAAVDLKYVARDMTKVEVRAVRDVEYSFELDQPVYLDTGWQVQLTQAITYEWDVRGQVAQNRLEYQPNAGITAPPRRDRIWVYGVGVGRRLGIEVRVGVDVIYSTRESNAPGRGYDGFRVGGSVTYGF